MIKKEKDCSAVEKMTGSFFEENKTNTKTYLLWSTYYVLPVFNGYISQYTKLINHAKQLKHGGYFIKHDFEARNILDDFNLILQAKER